MMLTRLPRTRIRIEVVGAYDYTCALTGHRLLTIDDGSIVEAAHIHPFSDRETTIRGMGADEEHASGVRRGAVVGGG
jgi:hypothetical protein